MERASIAQTVAEILGVDVRERCVDELRGQIEDLCYEEYRRGKDVGDMEGYGRGYDDGMAVGQEMGV